MNRRGSGDQERVRGELEQSPVYTACRLSQELRRRSQRSRTPCRPYARWWLMESDGFAACELDVCSRPESVIQREAAAAEAIAAPES